MTRKALLKPLLSLVTLLVVFGLGEAMSYLWGTFEGPSSPLRINDQMRVLAQYDALLFWSLRSNATVGNLSTSSLGLRGPEVPEVQPGEVRILSLGESSTFGWKLPVDQNYSSVLSRQLADDDTPPQVRVINAGIPGYTIFQGYQYFVHRGVALRPDIVLLYFGYNDFLPVSYLSSRARSSGQNDWTLFEARRQPLRRADSFLTGVSNLYRALRWRKAATVAREPAEADDGSVRVPLEHRRKLLSLFLEACERNGCQLVVVVPWYREFDDHVAALREFRDETGVEFIDLPALLAPRVKEPRADYFLDKTHPNRAGHRLIAEAIYERLQPTLAELSGDVR